MFFRSRSHLDYLSSGIKQKLEAENHYCKKKKVGDKKSEKNTDIIFLTTVKDIRTSSKKWLHKNLLVLLVNKTDTRTTHLSKGVII